MSFDHAGINKQNYSYLKGKFNNIKYILEKQYGEVNTEVKTSGYDKSYTNLWETNTTEIKHSLELTAYRVIHSILYLKDYSRKRRTEKRLKRRTQVKVENSTNKNQKDDLGNSSFSVFTSKDSNVFHKRNCPKLDTTNGTVGFTSGLQANNAGFVPCHDCFPKK